MIENNNINIDDKENTLFDKAHIPDINIDHYKIFVDGACSLKYNKGGIGVYNIKLNLNVSLCINDLFEKKTNSITELYAVKHALTLISMLNLSNPEQFTIYSDSKYVVNSLSIWIHNWKKNNWLRADKKPISHKNLIVEIYDLLSDLHISIKWIPREKNTFADKLAKKSIY